MLLQKDILFWYCALAGSGAFVIQFILILFGMGDEEGGMEGSFKWISKSAITGFLMMFGWVGLAAKQEFGLGPLASMGLGVGAGLAAMLISGSVFKAARKLRSSGTVFRIEDAVGKEAVVYQRIPRNGAGKISISLEGISHEIDAMSLNGDEIDSFLPVQIVKKADERTLIVMRK